MARPSGLSRVSKPTRPLREISDNDDDDDNDDEFPDIEVLVQRKIESGDTGKPGKQADKAPKQPASVRRRKLAPIANNNALLRAWTPESPSEQDEKPRRRKESRAPRVELRTKSTRTATSVQFSSTEANIEQEEVAEEEEVTIIEEVSIIGDNDDNDDSDDVFQSAESNVSSFEDEDDSDDSLTEFFARSARPKKSQPPTQQELGTQPANQDRNRAHRKGNPLQTMSKDETQDKGKQKPAGSSGRDLTDTFSRLNLDDIPNLKPENKALRPKEGKTKTHTTSTTPPASPPQPKTKPAGLVSPKKLPRIPQTPHRPSSDMFWSQDFVDDWNDEHSPRKQLFPDAVKAAKKNPPKQADMASPAKSKSMATSKSVSAREAKKAFEKEKHEMAEKFLQELDAVITGGKLFELAASTGGIKLNWTNKLNTTAGRANWRREKAKDTASHRASTTTDTNPKYKHHASIDIAEKIIDDEHRLLNTLAHEFCHLANFMINGLTTNPHGKEFKAWAAKCSTSFGHRGIQVTTKHTYEIDFKYAWECTACGIAYKRHSKSINPGRHRCGACKGELKQTKPVPRGAAAGKQPSEYQVFMKEQMRLLKEENPKSPQKDIMRLVASRWAERGRTNTTGSRAETPIEIDDDGEARVEKATKMVGNLRIEK
ncbi:SprT-like family domain containing protein [Naviculisporaceae sp. PSN 640]